MWWRFNNNKEQENNNEENKNNEDKKVVHDIVNETYDLEDNSENNEDKKSENNEDQSGSLFDFLNSNKDQQKDEKEKEVKIPDCENLIKVMRECTKKNDGTHNCKKEIDEWEKNCKKSWFS